MVEYAWLVPLFPLLGALAVAVGGRWLKGWSHVPIVAGIGSRNGTTAFVSRGVGTVYVPIRLNCPPEVAVLTLHGNENA